MGFITMIFAFLVIGVGILSFIGLTAALIVFTVLSIKRSENIKKLKKISLILSYVFIVGMIPAIILVTFSLASAAKIPEDFVDVAITAELAGDGFVTSEGQEFKKVPYQYDLFANSDPDMEARFAVKPTGLFKRSEWSNIYEFTADGKTLYMYNATYTLYCKAEDFEDVLSYFSDNSDWEHKYSYEPCSDEANAIIKKYEARNDAQELDYGNSTSWEDLTIARFSNDGAIIVDECTIIKRDGCFYICTYYIIEEYYHEYGFELTPEEAEIMQKEFDKEKENDDIELAA